MHKSLFNEAIIKLTIEPVGPILIKAGEGASDPTKPDMSFVRTMRNGAETIYLPGSSLKGVLRAHCERLARTVEGKKTLACDPLKNDSQCAKLNDNKDISAAQIHKKSCFLCRLFGNTSLASHFRISDAYPTGEYRTEERNGVAIDRVFGSVAVGPFNYETVTAGQFQATLHIKNFSLAQLGLLSLTLRDLAAERVRLGFGKSRGLGAVTARVDEWMLRYPSCEIEANQLRMLDGRVVSEASKLVGIGKFIEQLQGASSADKYGYAANDETALTEIAGYEYQSNQWGELEINAPKADGLAHWQPLGQACAAKWKEEVRRDH